MKKLKMLLATLSALAVVIVPASASAAPTTTVVAGKVTHNGSPVAGADVTAVCNTHSMTGTTNVNGDYGFMYSASDCPDGQTATVVASKNGLGGTNSGQVGAVGATLNIAIVNIDAVPELGLITGAAGVAGAGGLFFVMRRRQSAKLQQNA